MTTIGDDLGPVEGFAHRVEDRMRELTHPHLFRHHDAPQPAALTPTTPTPTPMEESVSLQIIGEIETAIKEAAGKFEAIDHDALTVLDNIKANPATAEAFSLIGALTGLPAADFSTALSVLRMVVAAAGGQPATGQ